MERAQIRTMRSIRDRHAALWFALAIGITLTVVTVGCSSGGNSPASGLTPLPLDEDARRMLLEPRDLPNDRWVRGGRDPLPLPTPTACDSPTQGLTGRAEVELENLSDELHLAGFYEQIFPFDAPSSAILSLSKAATDIRCRVDNFNCGEIAPTVAQSEYGTFTLLPAPSVGDSSVAYQIALTERPSGPGRSGSPFYYAQAIDFVDGPVLAAVTAHTLYSPLDDARLGAIAQAAFDKERSVRGLDSSATPTP